MTSKGAALSNGEIAVAPFAVADLEKDRHAPAIAALLTAAIQQEARAWTAPDITISGAITHCRIWVEPIGDEPGAWYCVRIDLRGYYAACDNGGRVLVARAIPTARYLSESFKVFPDLGDQDVLRPSVGAYGWATLEDLADAGVVRRRPLGP